MQISSDRELMHPVTAKQTDANRRREKTHQHAHDFEVTRRCKLKGNPLALLRDIIEQFGNIMVESRQQ
jgi:hypothetical protein